MAHGIFPNHGKAFQLEIRKAISKKEFKDVFYPEKKKRIDPASRKPRKGGDDD